MEDQVQIQSYSGSLLVTQLFSRSQTILLGSFGTMTTRTLTDDSGQIYVGESVQIGASTYTLIGSGSAQPGLSVLGVIVPTGTKVDLLIFSGLNGQLFFVYPDGAPNLTGAVALVVTVSPIGYNLGTGMILCFREGTLIRTVKGTMPVEQLKEGMRLPDIHGEKLKIIWTGKTQKMRQNRPPVLIPADHFEKGVPTEAVVLSAWHRLPVPHLGVLAPAAAFTICDGVVSRPDLVGAAFFHILLERHALINAQGLWAESFLPGPVAMESLSPAARQDIAYAMRRHQIKDYPPCAPLLTMRQAQEVLSKRASVNHQKKPSAAA
jgi:hypothetical protein